MLKYCIVVLVVCCVTFIDNAYAIEYREFMGIWKNDVSSNHVKFLADNTLYVRTLDNKFFRGHWVMKRDKDVLIYLLVQNKRIRCELEKFDKNFMSIGGTTELSGQWKKINNNFRGYW